MDKLKYKIIVGGISESGQVSAVDNLVRQVNEAIAQGCVPIGGPFVTDTSRNGITVGLGQAVCYPVEE